MAFNKDKVMDAARKFVDKGQIDKAVKEYLRIVHEDPKDVRVWLKIGDLYAKKGGKQDAIETYLKVARFYHEQGFVQKAVAVYKQVLKLDPRLVDVILKLAELYRQIGQMTEAMQHFESVAAHFHREGNTRDALATVKKLVDLDPENIATRIKLAELYSKEGILEDAANEFSVACDQLRRQGRQDDFIKVAERLLWHKPDNQSLNRELAALYLRRNDPRRALQKLQACFKADPRDVETLGLLAQAFQALDQKAKTVSVLKELARIHNENKQRDRATEVFHKILEFVPNDPDALQFLGPTVAAQVAAQAPAPIQQQMPMPPPYAQHTPYGHQPPAQVLVSAPQPAMPAAVRAATGAKFGITSDLPAYETAQPRMTGSMPLVDETALSGADFALPEYDDADFSADMEPAPDPRAMSAAGEEHAEEIAKILAETDVYVRYGLHGKAVDHLRRVFSLDPDNVEGRERLKDILLSQGREREAEAELLRLAELVAATDPERAEAYLHELIALNGTHTGAFELARRYRLRVARSSAPSEIDYQMSSGAVAAMDVEIDELDMGDGPRGGRAVGVARTRDSVDEFDPADLIGLAPGHAAGPAHARVATGSPPPGRPPRPPYDGGENYDMDFEASPSQSTRQMSPEHVEALNAYADAPRGWADANGHLAMRDAVNRQLDDAHGDEIDADVANELRAANGEDLPFDPDEARAFDRAVRGHAPPVETDAIYVSGFEETAMPQRVAHGSAHDGGFDASDEDGLGAAGGYDPYPTQAAAPAFDPTAAHARAESSMEDDLDEADFYAGQGMYGEALDVLRNLLAHYPNHPLVTGKLRDLEAQAHGVHEVPADAVEAVESLEVSGATDAIDLDELEEVGVDELEELPDSAPVLVPGKKRGPTVMLEKPVEEGDAETHYDLGLAYKEMGLFDEACKAFDKALRSPAREVQCRVMIGMCQREMGNPTDAIQQFKQGLHAEPSERERQSLYYEIGVTYEALGDFSEALYYFEMVTKRDPGFADAGSRANDLRSRGLRPSDSDL